MALKFKRKSNYKCKNCEISITRTIDTNSVDSRVNKITVQDNRDEDIIFALSFIKDFLNQTNAKDVFVEFLYEFWSRNHGHNLREGDFLIYKELNDGSYSLVAYHEYSSDAFAYGIKSEKKVEPTEEDFELFKKIYQDINLIYKICNLPEVKYHQAELAQWFIQEIEKCSWGVKITDKATWNRE